MRATYSCILCTQHNKHHQHSPVSKRPHTFSSAGLIVFIISIVRLVEKKKDRVDESVPHFIYYYNVEYALAHSQLVICYLILFSIIISPHIHRNVYHGNGGSNNNNGDSNGCYAIIYDPCPI